MEVGTQWSVISWVKRCRTWLAVERTGQTKGSNSACSVALGQRLVGEGWGPYVRQPRVDEEIVAEIGPDGPGVVVGLGS